MLCLFCLYEGYVVNGFIHLTKDNRSGDRMLVAVDAICAVEEQQETRNVSIKTMDGFWYDVVDRIEDIEAKIADAFSIVKIKEPKKETKAEYLRRKRLVAPTCDEIPKVKNPPEGAANA